MSRPEKYPLAPKSPERVCWGCDRFCPVGEMACSKARAEHPSEAFGPDWARRFPELLQVYGPPLARRDH